MTAGVTTIHVLVPWLRLRGELSGSGSPIAVPTVRRLQETAERFEARRSTKCAAVSVHMSAREWVMGIARPAIRPDSPQGSHLTAGVGFPVAVLAFLSIVSPEPDRTALGAVGSEVCAGQAAGNRDRGDHTKPS